MIRINEEEIIHLNAGGTAVCGCSKVFKDSGFWWWRKTGEQKLKAHQKAKIKCWYMKDPKTADAFFNLYR